MGVQVTVSASQIDKERLGYQAISLTHFTDTAEPSIAAGSKVEIGGALYEFTGDETCTGWAGATASQIAYILLTPSGASVAGSYTNTAPTWDAAKQGWYTGSNRVVAMLYKDAASLYQAKNIIPPGEGPLTFLAPITSTVNPFVFNLPASSGGGMRVRVIDYAIASTNLVKITPNGTDNIGSAGNVSCYIQNIDQSGVVYKHQFLDLVDSASGTWTVVGGQFCPAQGTDTNGQQYHLGKLHHLPLANTTARQVVSAVPPTVANWSAAVTGAGVYGVPAGAKAIRVRVHLATYATAAGLVSLQVAFSDNNGNAPATTTAHPQIFVASYSTIGLTPSTCSELDIPLNASGQFYYYTILATNCTLASSIVLVEIIGFYMGD